MDTREKPVQVKKLQIQPPRCASLHVGCEHRGAATTGWLVPVPSSARLPALVSAMSANGPLFSIATKPRISAEGSECNPDNSPK